MVSELKDQINAMANALWANSAFDENGKETQEARAEQITLLNQKISDISEFIYEGTGPLADEKREDDVFDSPFFKNSVNKSKGSDKINYNKSFKEPVIEVDD